MSVVRELARVVADGIRKFEPEVVMGLPTGGLVLAPFVAEELGFSMLFLFLTPQTRKSLCKLRLVMIAYDFVQLLSQTSSRRNRSENGVHSSPLAYKRGLLQTSTEHD